MNNVKALARINYSRRALNWRDMTDRSPKAMNDMSGVIAPRVTPIGESFGIQDFNYETIAKLFICHDLVWACVNLVSSTVALAQLRVRERNEQTYSYLEDHPLQQLLEYPNASMTQFDLLQAYVTHQMLFGTNTFFLIREGMDQGCDNATDGACMDNLYNISEGPIAQILPIHPSLLSNEEVPLLNKRCWVYRPVPEDRNKVYPVHPNNLLTDPIYNTEVAWYGISPTFLLKRWLDLDTAMVRQLSSFFENGAIPSMLVNLKPPPLGAHYREDPQNILDMLKSRWMSTYSKRGTAYKSPAFLYGDINIERIQEKIEEMVAKKLFYEIQSRVCLTYGVPPSMFEFGQEYGSQRSSQEQQSKDFFNRTIAHYLRRIKSKVNTRIVPSFIRNNSKLEVAWDLSEMGVASFLLEAQEAKQFKLWEMGLSPRNEVRMKMGLDPIKGDLGDDLYRITVLADAHGNVAGTGQSKIDKNLSTGPESLGSIPASETGSLSAAAQ